MGAFGMTQSTLGITLLHLQPITRLTVSTAIVYVCVGFVVGVTRWTMRLRTHMAATLSAPDVLRVRDRLKMFRVDTHTKSAKMVQACAEGDGAVSQLPTGTMREDLPTLSGKNHAIACAGDRANPQPTTLSFLNLRPKAILEGR